MTQPSKRMGRPPSTNPQSELLHIRVTPDIVEWLDIIAEDRIDAPSQAALVREALAEFIRKYRDNRLKAQK